MSMRQKTLKDLKEFVTLIFILIFISRLLLILGEQNPSFNSLTGVFFAYFGTLW